MQKWARGLLLASLTALAVACLSTSAPASITIGFNPTGGGLGGTTNFGTLTIGTIDELPGSAMAVNIFGPGGTAPAVGSTFTLLYQANVGNLLDASNNPIFGYGISGNTGQLTAVASFTEQITSFSATAATFTTVGGGDFTLWFNPTRAANNLTGTDFAPGTPGNTLAAGTFTKVYEGPIQAGGTGNFSSNGVNSGALDQSPGGNAYPGVNTVNGNGGTILNSSTTTANPAFFITSPPASLLTSLNNTSNNLPFNQVHPSAIFFDGTTGVASVGTVNGLLNNGARNVMFQADANTAFNNVVPEPSTISAALTGIGLVFLARLRARRRQS
jgi:hypothetical protein